MNKNLLAIARHAGDINFAINGEGKVSLAINGEWTNLQTVTFTGDQGCVYPNRPVAADAEDPSALGAAIRVLKNINVVPYQNDSTFQHYVTPEIQTWLHETLPAELLKQFRDHHDVFKVQAEYKPEGEKEAILVVSLEVATNQYANGIFEDLGELSLLGNVTVAKISDGGNATYTYVDIDNNENTIERDISDNSVLIGTDSFTLGKVLWSNDKDTLIIASEYFVPTITESKIVKI